MTNEQKLVSLLQPKSYVSKLKLYCLDCRAEKTVEKFGSLELKSYISRIKILEQ